MKRRGFLSSSFAAPKVAGDLAETANGITGKAIKSQLSTPAPEPLKYVPQYPVTGYSIYRRAAICSYAAWIDDKEVKKLD